MNSYNDYYTTKREAPANSIPEPQTSADVVLPEVPPLTEDELKKDPDFIANAWTWYNSSESARLSKVQRRMQEMQSSGIYYGDHLKDVTITTDEEVAQWAVNASSRFNNNLGAMAVDWQEMRKQPIGQIKAMLGVLDAYDQTELSTRQVVRGVANAATDPFTWAGFSLLAKSASQGLVKNKTKGYLRSILAKKLNNPIVVGGAEGFAFGASAGHVDEGLRSQVEQRDYNASIPMIYGGVGLTLGSTFGATPAIAKGIAQKFKGYRANGDGATMTDSKLVAQHYGDDVTEKTIEAQNPVFFDEVTTADEIADKLDLDEDAANALTDSIDGAEIGRTPIPTAQAMQQEAVQQALLSRDIDMVGYPERLDMSQEARLARAAEQGFDIDNVYYHGSTHDIGEFDSSKANQQNHFGRGAYFSTSADDASNNYGKDGADLANRIQYEAESLEPIILEHFDDIGREDYLRRLYDGSGDLMFVSAHVSDMNDADAAEYISKKLSENKIKGETDGIVYPTYLKRENTFDISADGDTFLDSMQESDYEDFTHFLDDAGGDEELAKELFDEDRLNAEPTGALADFMQYMYDNHGDEAEPLISKLNDHLYGGGISGKKLDEIFRSTEMYIEDKETGDIINSDAYSKALKHAGFDSIKHDADIFNGIDVEPGASHIIMLDDSKIRSKFAKFGATAAAISSKDLLAEEAADENSSLDVNGVSMTYRVVGGEANEAP